MESCSTCRAISDIGSEERLLVNLPSKTGICTGGPGKLPENQFDKMNFQKFFTSDIGNSPLWSLFPSVFRLHENESEDVPGPWISYRRGTRGQYLKGLVWRNW